MTIQKTFILLILLGLCCFLYAGDMLFFDDFNKGKTKDWSVTDQGKDGAPSSWVFQENAYIQKSNIYSEDGANLSGTYSVCGDVNWTDYAFEADIRSTDDDIFGILFRYIDDNNYYRFRICGSDQNNPRGSVLERKYGGKWTIVTQNPLNYNDSKWHHLRILLVNKRIIIYYDDKDSALIDFEDKDSQLLKGKIGLYSWGNQGSYFDNIKISAHSVNVRIKMLSRVLPVNQKITFLITAENYTDTDSGIFINYNEKIKTYGAPQNILVPKKNSITVNAEMECPSPGKASIIIKDKNQNIILENNMLFIKNEYKDYYILFGDFHMHTTYSDGKNMPIEMLIQSKRKGLDVISVTDHRTAAGSDSVKTFLRTLNINMTVIRGEENPCDFVNTHLLAYNIPVNINHIASDCPEEFKGNTEQMIEWAKKQGIIFFQAHPTWSSHKGTDEEKLKFTSDILAKKIIHGIEYINSTLDDFAENKSTMAFIEKQYEAGNFFPILGSSDSHSLSGLGTVRTIIFTESSAESDILDAIKNGRTVIWYPSKNILFGRKELVAIAEIYLNDFMTEHDRLAEEEAETLRLYWGGHYEKFKLLNEYKEKWKELYKIFFPFRKERS